MKYKITLIAAILFAFFLSSCEFNNNPVVTNSVTAQRKLLVELSTSSTCTNCPPAENFLNQIDSASGITSSDTSVVIIEFHTPIPTPGDPFYAQNMPASNARKNFYDVQVNPTLLIGGSTKYIGFDAQSWTNSINIKLSQKENYNLTFNIAYDTATRNGSVDISLLQTGGANLSDLKLFIAVTENKLPFGTKFYHNVLRDFITDANGDDMQIAIGQPFSVTKNFVLNSIVTNPYNTNITVFAQSMSTKDVVVVARKKLL
jgi:hypothetical protein